MASLRTLHTLLTHPDVAPRIDELVDARTPPMQLWLHVGGWHALHVTFPQLSARTINALAMHPFAAEPRGDDDHSPTKRAHGMWVPLEADGPHVQGAAGGLTMVVIGGTDGVGPLEVDVSIADGDALDSDALQAQVGLGGASAGPPCTIPLRRVRHIAAYDGRQHWRLTYAFPSVLPSGAVYRGRVKLTVRTRAVAAASGVSTAAPRPELKAARVVVLRFDDDTRHAAVLGGYDWHSGLQLYRLRLGRMVPKYHMPELPL
jgi:hypothetical protein